MRRACETARAIAKACPCSPEVIPELHEVGGLYHAQLVSGEHVKVPGTGLTREQFAKDFPGFDTSRLPAVGQWDNRRGFEPTMQSITRAADVAAWLCSESLQAEIGEGTLVLVNF